MDLSDKIKALRNELEMTLDDVAEKVGVSASTIMRYEKGQITNLKRDKIKALADALETTPAYLMGWVDDPKVDEKTNGIRASGEYENQDVDSTLKSNVEPISQKRSFCKNDYTEHEQAVIEAYRRQPEMQPAVDKILGVTPKLFNLAKVARRQEKLELTEGELKAILKSAKDAPNSSQDRNMF